MLTLADIVAGVARTDIAGSHATDDWLPLDWAAELSSRPVREVVIDSREVIRGDVFVALPGEHVDGHNFVSHALGRGAIAVLVHHDIDLDRFADVVEVDVTTAQISFSVPLAIATSQGEGEHWPLIIHVDNVLAALQRLAAFWRSKFPEVRVIGITGSLGKTTTKELTAQVLGTRYSVLKNEGNRNNEIGVPLTLLQLRPDHQYAVIEMGMYARGEIALFASLARPHIGVITMVGPVHQERLGSIENIALAKAELVEALPEDGVAILNDDDERVRVMAAVSKAPVVTYGLTSRADVWANEIESYGLEGISFTLHHREQAFPMRVPLLGRHSVHTALRAATVAMVTGMTWEEILDGFLIPAPQLRLAASEGPVGSLVLDDTYNASEESTIAALNLLDEVNGGTHIAVLGDMLELGEAEVQAHRNVGCRAALVAQYIVCVGPRARWIAEEAEACADTPAKVYHVMDNAAALAVLRDIIHEKCVILVKGSRGMRMDEIVAGLAELA